jgi:hypothetical protein
MGSVYLAEDERLARRVALKVVLPELSQDDGFRQRFEEEARNAAAIDHPNVVPILSAGSSNGLLYLAMRYVDGTDLDARLRSQGTLETDEAIWIVAQVAEALDAAHAKGLIHRDVKPANILLEAAEPRDAVYLTDFGIVRRLGGPELTQTGQVLASLDYAAPEQVKSGRVDARTDVYSLGCVLYRALSGEVPHPVSDAQKVWSIVEDPTPSVPGIPQRLNEAIARATTKDPDDRFPSAGDFARTLIEGPSRDPERSVAIGAAATGALEDGTDQAPTRVMPNEIFVSSDAVSTERMPKGHSRPTGGRPGRGVRRAATILGAAALIGGGVVVAALLAAGGTDTPKTVVRESVVTKESSAHEEAEPVPPAETSNQTPSEPVPGLSSFEGAAYLGLAPVGWTHKKIDVEEEEESGMLTNTWVEPSSPDESYIRIDGGNSVDSSSPVRSSENVVKGLEADPEYREVAYEEVEMGGIPAVRWVFEIEGDKRVDYFFVECLKGLAVIGSTTPERFPELAPMFHEVAATTYLRCGDY